MYRLKFSYEQILSFSKPIHGHKFMYRCIPKSEPGQVIEQMNVDISPCDFWSYGWDSHGNRTIYGTTNQEHDKFILKVSGISRNDWTIYDQKHRNIYLLRAQTDYTRPDEDMISKIEDHLGMIWTLKNDYKRSVKIMDYIYDTFTYTKNVTTVTTKAAEAFAMAKGVCQDYAHVMIGICRYFQIPARYVSGMMVGEGYSHAWVEIFSDGKWYGFDPTNHLLIDDTYIRFSRGRDCTDCILNQGIYYGICQEKQEIKASVEVIK